MTKLAFVDCETTGLDPDVHEIWDVGLILRDEIGGETRWEWRLPVDLSRADAFALNLGRFHERHPLGLNLRQPYLVRPESRPEHFARQFARLTWGAHLVGNVVSFDEERLRKLLRANRECPGWHYHLVDVEALVAGRLGIHPPWKSDELSREIGVVPPGPGVLHTAIGDAAWAMAMYDEVMGIRIFRNRQA